MPNKISAEVRKTILDDLLLIGGVTGGLFVSEFAKRVYPELDASTEFEIARHMDRFNDWDFIYLFNTVLNLYKAPDEVFIRFCEEYVNPIISRDDDISQKCIEAINHGLSSAGLSLQEADVVASKIKYKVVPVNHGVQKPIKNIIFAAKYKPDIVLDNALENDIQVIKANGALVYDQGIPSEGISWETLKHWYELLEIDNTEEDLIELFYNCLDSEPERMFYKAYISYLKKHGENIPALIPQVYMYYDPKAKKQREWKIFEHQKMDFMMIISPTQRVVFEIDGSQHYAEDDIVPGTQYKHYASPSRYAEMMQAHRKMVLAGYDVYRFGGRELWVNESITEKTIFSNINEFFDMLFDKYHVDIK